MNKETLLAKRDLILRLLNKLVELIHRGLISYPEAEGDINAMLDQMLEIDKELEDD